MRLQNKVAFITGASRGLGKAIAIKFAEEGADVAITYNKNKSMAEEVSREIERLGKRALVLKCDLSKMEDVKNAAEAAMQKFKRVDILVNNGAILIKAGLLETDENTWNQTLDTNLKGTFFLIKYLAKPMMDNRYGKIINISAFSALGNRSASAAYAASKAGLLSLTRILSKDLAPYNITVNAIAPGPVDTELMRSGSTEVIKYYMDNIPLKRFAQPEDIANAALFLASDESSYITGQTLALAGGL